MLSSSQKQRIMLKSILLDGKSLQEAALWAKIWEKKLYCLPQRLQLHKPIISFWGNCATTTNILIIVLISKVCHFLAPIALILQLFILHYFSFLGHSVQEIGNTKFFQVRSFSPKVFFFPNIKKEKWFVWSELIYYLSIYLRP